MTGTRYIRYADLVARGIVSNRQTLSRWQREHGFPAGIRLGPNTTAWREADVDRWIAARQTTRAAEAA